MALATEPVTLRPRGERLRGPLLTLGGLAAATVALHVRDPHTAYSWGVCPLYALTGVYCPGCGGLRGVNDLSDGHLGAAASSNLLLVLLAPVALVLLARWTVAAWHGRPTRVVPPVPRWLGTSFAVLVVVFTVARNLPGSWLAP